MHSEMSQLTRKEILGKLRKRYERAGVEYKSRLITEVVELFGYERRILPQAPLGADPFDLARCKRNRLTGLLPAPRPAH